MVCTYLFCVEQMDFGDPKGPRALCNTLQLEAEIEFLQNCLEPFKVNRLALQSLYAQLRSRYEVSVEERGARTQTKNKLLMTAQSSCKMITQCWG